MKTFFFIIVVATLATLLENLPEVIAIFRNSMNH
jgi:hypothetical protein